MALYRRLCRRKTVVVLFLTATTFWIFYLILSAPASTDEKYVNSMMPSYGNKVENRNSVTRKVVAIPFEPPIIDDKANVLPQPPVNFNKSKEVTKELEKSAKIDSDSKNNAAPKQTDKTMNQSKIGDPQSVNGTKNANNITRGPVLKEMEKKVIAIGEQLKNKTIEDWETMKNKTLEKLTDLGVIQKKKYVKLIYSPVEWNINMTMEDIGQILKDTEFLKKRQNLTEMEYQPLLPPNATVNINITQYKYGLGYCDCVDLSCLCCVRMLNKGMKVNHTACSGIKFSSMSQELQFEFSIEKKTIFQSKIAAEFPPKVCMAEAKNKAAGACVLFSNVTSKVNIESENYKLHLSGCMEFDLTLYNKTVSAFPVGCFQIPGKNVKDLEDERAQNIGNFVP